jgi:hypothetical protein
LLSPTSQVAAEADVVAATAATKIDHQAELKLLAAIVAAVIQGGRWSILLSFSLWEHPPTNPEGYLENSLRWTP